MRRLRAFPVSGPLLCRCKHGRLSHEGGDGRCGCGCPEFRPARPIADGPPLRLGVDVVLGEPAPQPGVPWVDAEGVRRFICPVCGGCFVSDPAMSDEEREAEELVNLGAVNRDDRRSVCDVCYPVILERARDAGLI